MDEFICTDAAASLDGRGDFLSQRQAAPQILG